MRIYIFTEGGPEIGYGHITRCSALYDELELRGHEVEFIIYGDEQVQSVLRNRKSRILNWYSKDTLSSLFKQKAMAIVDSYLASEEVYQWISLNAERSLYIDDTMRIQYPKGIVANPSLHVEGSAYKKDREIQYLLGAPYVILRKTFQEAARFSINKKAKEVLVIIGGSDPFNLTPRIVRTVNDTFPDLLLNVVIGKGFKQSNNQIVENDKNTRFFYRLDGSQMKELMLRSDFAITAAGQTIYELIRTQTPFIPIQVADNQRQNVAGIQKFNLVHHVLYLESRLLMNELKQEVQSIMDYEHRFALFKKMEGCIDGLGSARIIDALLT